MRCARQLQLSSRVPFEARRALSSPLLVRPPRPGQASAAGDEYQHVDDLVDVRVAFGNVTQRQHFSRGDVDVGDHLQPPSLGSGGGGVSAVHQLSHQVLASVAGEASAGFAEG